MDDDDDDDDDDEAAEPASPAIEEVSTSSSIAESPSGAAPGNCGLASGGQGQSALQFSSGVSIAT